MRAGKTFITQRAAEASNLTPGQTVGVIYAMVGKEAVLLAAVIESTEPPKR